MPKKIDTSRFSPQDQIDIASLPFRAARERFKCSYREWTRCAADALALVDLSVRSQSEEEALERVLASVRENPQFTTPQRAALLKMGSSRVQRLLAGEGLSKLNQRLVYAGYKVEAVRPLQVARMRRIVALYPGALTHIDYKTFAHIPRLGGPQQRIGGYVVIDSLTGFAQVHLSERTGVKPASEALDKYIGYAPFAVRGLLLSDNGPTDFMQIKFIDYVRSIGLLHRTTHHHHPWSNGKVEALNKTLAYQCFPALALAHFTNLAQVQEAVDIWMTYYNEQRAHHGHINRGLPPIALLNLWQKAEGNNIDKLEALGVFDLKDEWTMRMMGAPSSAGVQLGADGGKRGPRDRKSEVPFAVVLERTKARPPEVTNVEKLPSPSGQKLIRQAGMSLG